MTEDDRQELRGHEARVADLKAAYVAACDERTRAFGGRPNRAKRLAAFEAWREAGTAYFNAFDRKVVIGARVGADRDPTWRTDCAETAADLLRIIALHYATLDGACDLLGLAKGPLWPTPKAFAAMQRLVRAVDPGDAKLVRDDFVRLGLPTQGFDTPEAAKTDPQTLAWRFYGVGAVWLIVMLGFLVAGFVIRDLSPDQRWIIRLAAPVSFAFSAWSFSGTLVATGSHPLARLAVSATGGFGVFLLTPFVLPHP